MIINNKSNECSDISRRFWYWSFNDFLYLLLLKMFIIIIIYHFNYYNLRNCNSRFFSWNHQSSNSNIMHESFEDLCVLIDKLAYFRWNFNIIIPIFRVFNFAIIEKRAYFVKNLFVMNLDYHILKISDKIDSFLW